MNTNESIRNDIAEDIIVLGVASIETKGPSAVGEGMGSGPSSGISED